MSFHLNVINTSALACFLCSRTSPIQCYIWYASARARTRTHTHTHTHTQLYRNCLLLWVYLT